MRLFFAQRVSISLGEQKKHTQKQRYETKCLICECENDFEAEITTRGANKWVSVTTVF